MVRIKILQILWIFDRALPFNCLCNILASLSTAIYRLSSGIVSTKDRPSPKAWSVRQRVPRIFTSQVRAPPRTINLISTSDSACQRVIDDWRIVGGSYSTVCLKTGSSSLKSHGRESNAPYGDCTQASQTNNNLPTTYYRQTCTRASCGFLQFAPA